ncbi:MAG: hypothetical protein VM34scaffold347_60 [Phage 66_12]|jgi:hypothetical protein|nr:MAG: hypothetical protein VM34scaffold347_60 [Phage 66_12]
MAKHKDNTVSNKEWSHVLKAAAHTFEQLPDPEACIKRSKASSLQQKRAKEGKQ